jgi:tetratricopeptide (TPR) repeat protein
MRRSLFRMNKLNLLTRRLVRPELLALGCLAFLALAAAQLSFGFMGATAVRQAAGAYLLFRARTYQERGLVDPGVVRYLDWAAALTPRSAEIYFRRCLQQAALGEDRLAVEDCSRALDIQPSRSDALLHRAHAYFRLGAYAHALEDYSSLVERGEWMGEACYWQGHTALKLELASQAANGFGCGLAYADDPRDALLWLGWAETISGNYPAAIAAFNKIILTEGDNPDVLIGRGAAYAGGGSPEKAKQDLDAAIRLDPAYPLGYFHRARLYVFAGDLERAAADLEQAMAQCMESELCSEAESLLREISLMHSQ